MTADLHFVTTLYGDKYLGFLIPHLYSIWKYQPDSEITVIWNDLPRHFVDLLAQVFPKTHFLEMDTRIVGDTDSRIARKISYWQEACRLHPDSTICFIDCDTLLIKPIDYLLSYDVDIIFTWKDEPFPINTGVLILKVASQGIAFFEDWIERIESVIHDSDLKRTAIESSGSIDQYTLREMIGFVNYDRLVDCQINNHNYRFKGFPCSILNETNCVPISDDTHIIHYKSGWHPILLDGRDYSKNRPQMPCSEMHQFWKSVDQEAKDYVARQFVIRSIHNHLINQQKSSPVKIDTETIISSVMQELAVDVVLDAASNSTFETSEIWSPSLKKIAVEKIAEHLQDKSTHIEGQKIALMIDGKTCSFDDFLLAASLKDIIAVFIRQTDSDARLTALYLKECFFSCGVGTEDLFLAETFPEVSHSGERYFIALPIPNEVDNHLQQYFTKQHAEASFVKRAVSRIRREGIIHTAIQIHKRLKV